SAPRAKGENALQSGRGLQRAERRGGERHALPRSHPLRGEHELLRLPDREIAQQYGIEEREDGGVRADSQSERKHGGQRESGASAHRAKGVAHVLPKPVERSPTPRLAHEF